ELQGFIDLQIVRRPVSGECRDRWFGLIAVADFLTSVTAIFRSEHELFLCAIVVAERPAVIGTLIKDHYLLGRKVPALLCSIELWPVFMQLIAAMLGDVQAT